MASSFTIGEQFEGFVRAMVTSGRNASASQVMRDGLGFMEEREKLREAKLVALQHAIKEGLESGPAAPLDMDAVKTKARQRRSAKTAS